MATFFWPVITLDVLALWLGAYMLVGGIFGLVAAVRAATHHGHWGVMLLEGVVGIAAGLLTFFWPLATVQAVLMVLAIWAILIGMMQVAGLPRRPGTWAAAGWSAFPHG